MQSLKLIGWIIAIAGAVILIAGGVSYTKERDAVRVGGVEIAAERKGFISPVYGAVLVLGGLLIVFGTARRRRP